MDRKSFVPLYRQVYDQLRQAIVYGDLHAGSRLPSTRGLAKQLHVSRNTILNAYEALCFEGFVVGVTGSGTRVRNSSLYPRSFMMTNALDPRRTLREAHFPAAATKFPDPDGNVLYAYH